MAQLYAIGVGPGAPDLLTLRAVNALRAVDVVLCAASPNNDYSIALNIARPHLKDDAHIVRLEFPMTRDKATLHMAWDKAAVTTAAILAEGKTAAFLTLGDPLIYSTFAYLWRALARMAPHIKICIVSGITSFQAAAAKLNMSLCEGDEPLTIIPGILPEKELSTLLANDGSCAILKAYRNYKAITQAFKAAGRDKNVVMATAVEQEGEKFQSGVPTGKPPYMTLILCGPKSERE